MPQLAPQLAPQPTPPSLQQDPVPPAPSPGGVTQNGQIINDLPVDAKLAIRAAAAKVRVNVRPSNSTRSFR